MSPTEIWQRRRRDNPDTQTTLQMQYTLSSIKTNPCSMNMVIIQVVLDNKSVFVINTYIPPSNSKGNKNCSAKNYDILHQAVSSICEHFSGSILLCGDFNARIGCSQDFSNHKFAANILPCTTGSDVFSRVTVIPPGVPISAKRVSMDVGSNSHKNPFLTYSEHTIFLL